jgi:hypothetical protein
LGLGVLSVAIAVLAVESSGGLAHGSSRPLSITMALVSGWAVLSWCLTWLVLGRGRSTLAPRPRLLVAAAIAAPVALFAWMSAFHGTYVEVLDRVGYRCLMLTLLIAALPLGGVLWLRRGVEPRRPYALGAASGATCGAWATVVIDAWCPLTNAAHLLMGHVAPLVLLIVIGALLGARHLRPRPDGDAGLDASSCSHGR